MNKTWIVFKTEFINTVTRRSFLIMLILVPLVPALILGGISLFKGEDSDAGITEMFQPDLTVEVHEGYVDQAGIINGIPDWITEDRLVAYTDAETARRDTLSGKLTGYYVIKPDYLEYGSILYYREDFNPITGFESTPIIDGLINYNLLGADQSLYQAYQNPIRVEKVDIAPDVTELDQSNPLSYYIPYSITFLLYFVIINASSMLLASIAKEKENRVIEIILSSIKPEQLLTGKILGLGLAGLLQMVVWMGSALLLLRIGGTTIEIPAGLQFTPEILLWGIIFFILGYMLYATIMAGIGALVPNLKESSQATIFVVLPAIVPLMMINEIAGQPDSTISIILSLIPFTASSTIVTRLTVSAIPAWQLIASIGLLFLTFILLVRAVARMFRAQNLLTGKKFSFGLFLSVLFSRKKD